MEDKLPDKPSELLKLALRDLEKCELDPNYIINMAVWFLRIDYSERCYVCMAGSVLAQEYYGDLIPITECAPSNFKTPINRKLTAIDWFRRGHLSPGLYELGRSVKMPYIDVISYHIDKEKFKRKINEIIQLFETFNL